MGQHLRWQAIITLIGIVMMLAVLSFLAFSPRITITTNDKGGTYVEGVAGQPQFINPLLAAYNQTDQDLVALIFNGLTQADGYGNLKPDLAESWEVSEDGLAYLFKLRSDIYWQDGTPFTADDVMFTVKLLQDPDFPGAPYLSSLWHMVTAVELDNNTIRFVLASPVPTFMDFTTIGILPAHRFPNIKAADLLNQPFNLQPIGTGSFKLDTITAEFARLVPNRFYVGPKPHFKAIEFRFYPTHQELLTAYQRGEILGGTIPTQNLAVAETIDNLNLYHAQLSSYALIYFNLADKEKAPFFQEPEIRQALSYGIDREEIIDKALHGQGLVADRPILAWSWAYNARQPQATFDLEKANNLLTRLGWADENGDGVREHNNISLTFALLTSDDPLKVEVANVIKAQWAKLGVAVTVEVVGIKLNERLEQHQFQAALAEIALFGDPDPYPLWHSSQIAGGQNYSSWDNRQASLLLERARNISNRGQRNDLYFEFQHTFADEVPAIVLYNPIYTYAVRPEIKNVQIAPLISPSDRFRSIADWYILTQNVIEQEVKLE